MLLLAVNSQNEEMISQDLTNIFNKVEPHILIKYPEIWQFVVIKLNYHGMLTEKMIGMLSQEYLKHHKTYKTNNYFVLDLLINNTGKVRTLNSMIENLKIENFDDNNISHLISKFYKFAKNNKTSEIDDENCLEIARELYNKSEFKSTRLNSSHLLGESIFLLKIHMKDIIQLMNILKLHSYQYHHYLFLYINYMKEGTMKLLNGVMIKILNH